MWTIPYRNLTTVSSMRKLALAAWGAPTDPSVNVQLDLDITHLLMHLGGDRRQLKYAMVKLMSMMIHTVPELNMVIVRGKLRQRANNRIFVPTVFRHNRQWDLNGIFIDDAFNMSVTAIKSIWQTKVSRLRRGEDIPIERVARLFKRCPYWAGKSMVWVVDFIQYTLNISLEKWGLPSDRFGAITMTFLDKFNVRYANIPLFPLSRSGLTFAVGTPYVAQDKTLLPITCTFDHRYFDGLEGHMGYKQLRRWLKRPETWLGASGR